MSDRQLERIRRRFRDLGPAIRFERITGIHHVPLQAEWVCDVQAYPPGTDRGMSKDLVSYLAVEADFTIHRRNGIGDSFTILEGDCAGWHGARARKFGDPYPFAAGAPPREGGPAVVRFDRVNEKLWYGSTGPIRACTFELESPAPGTYDLEIPGFRHFKAVQYGRYATAWFRVGGSVEFFLHPGQETSGCITVTWINRWPELFRYLMTRRKDVRNVGTIQIFDGVTTLADRVWLNRPRDGGRTPRGPARPGQRPGRVR